MSSRLNKPDTTADKQVRECIEQKKSFVMTAGPASGKTTYLKKAIKLVIDIHGEELTKSRQKIACITASPSNAKELWIKLGKDPRIRFSAIHNFLWSLIEPFQNDIRDALLSSFNRKIKALKEKDSSETNSDISLFQSHIKNISSVKKIQFDHLTNYSSGVLGLTDMQNLVIDLIKSKPTLRKLIARQFPFIFIDESQLISKNLVEALMVIKEVSLCLGFFGDPMQNILHYETNQLDSYSELVQITEASNFRCSYNILKLANKIRAKEGFKEQFPGKAEGVQNSQPYEGEVHLFILPADVDKRESNFRAVQNFMAIASKDEQWKFDEKDHKRVKRLVLNGKLALKNAECADLYKTMYSTILPMEYVVNLLDQNTWLVTPWLDTLVSLTIAQAEGRKYEVISLLRKFSPALKSEKIKSGAEVAKTLKQLSETLSLIGKMLTDTSRIYTICDLLNLIYEKEFLPLNPILIAYMQKLNLLKSNSAEQVECINDLELNTLISNFCRCKVTELIPYYNYFSENSSFLVHYEAVGKEIDRLLVVIDHSSDTRIPFVYEPLFDLQFEYEYFKKFYWDKLNDEDRAIILSMTHRNFYVSCTRAKKDLAVVLFTSDQDAKAKIVARNLFERKNIHTEDDLKKALEKQDGPAV